MKSSAGVRASNATTSPAPARVECGRFAMLPPLALYVHLPWCIRKCPYCDFNSYEARGPLAERSYVDALLRDLEADVPLAQGRRLECIFLGGGTPSLFSGEAIAELLSGVRARLPLAHDAEITLEANPGAVDTGRFAQYQAAGVNRLSIGVQSFRDAQLAQLGRVHAAADARQAFVAARAAGFENVNLDLMYGLPGDDVAGALADLRAALELRPEHLSWYQLTLEPNTAFHRRPPPLPSEQTVLETELAGRALLAENGYARYEVSAYARAERRCRHNLNYWEFGDYLGIGAGAHGKLTLTEEQVVLRRAKQRNPRSYVDRAGMPQSRTDERVETGLALEFVMNGLRLLDGVAIECFEERTGCAFHEIASGHAAGAARGWLVDRADRLQATPAGLRLLNKVLELF